MEAAAPAPLPAPLDDTITIGELTEDPYPVYKRLRAETPVLRVKSLGRTLLTRAEDTRRVKDDPELFSANDPDTPMERAILAHALMLKDGKAHRRERDAMQTAFNQANIGNTWDPAFRKIAGEYISSLPKGEIADLAQALAGPFAARCLAHLLGITSATDEEMQRWSAILIAGVGNFGWSPEPFEQSDIANREMDALFESEIPGHRSKPDASALSAMVNARAPIPKSQIFANLKIALGGGINGPRNALLTTLFGLLTNPDQLEAAKADGLWQDAFDEGVRWVAPVQASTRLVTRDTVIRDCFIPKGDVVMTVQASANRDEEVYGDDAGSFDLFRNKEPHQALGNGPHACQGADVATQMIAGVMLPLLFERFPEMSLPDPQAVKFHGFAFRGPLSMPVLLN